MDPMIAGILALIIFFVLVFKSVPIGIAFAIVGTLCIVVFRSWDSALYIMASQPYEWASARMLLPVPLFMLMGYFAFYSGISKELYEAAHRWFGRLSGGIAMGTTLASAGFAACCGAPMASAATMGSIAYPEMERLKYDQGISTASIAAGGTISALIPPSIPLILYGMLSGTSVRDLFLAGIIPGILLSSLFLLLIYVWCKVNPQLGPIGPTFSMKEKMVSLVGVLPMLLLFVLVIGGLYGGYFVPSEAGAIGALGAFLIGIGKRKLPVANIIAAAKETGRVVSMVAMIIVGSQIFNAALGVMGFSRQFSNWIEALDVSPYVVLLFVIIAYIVMGMVLDVMAIIMLTIPTLAPIMEALGFDLVWFGVVIITLAMLGFITPPIGVNLFIVQGVTGVDVELIYKKIMPFVVMTLICVGIMVAFPDLVTFLPEMAR